MTLIELRAKLPTALQPFADKYGPVVLAWTALDLMAWIERLVHGDIEGAYRQILAGLSEAEFLAEGKAIFGDWQAANAENAARIALQKSAIVELLKIVLAIALASVGL
ncbi:MAG: hypothetical protein IMZ55_06385 [Acidobacteria bacterium]|nr:hypothetical protein [Acidobacteriota bacterium]